MVFTLVLLAGGCRSEPVKQGAPSPSASTPATSSPPGWDASGGAEYVIQKELSGVLENVHAWQLADGSYEATYAIMGVPLVVELRTPDVDSLTNLSRLNEAVPTNVGLSARRFASIAGAYAAGSGETTMSGMVPLERVAPPVLVVAGKSYRAKNLFAVTPGPDSAALPATGQPVYLVAIDRPSERATFLGAFDPRRAWPDESSRIARDLRASFPGVLSKIEVSRVGEIADSGDEMGPPFVFWHVFYAVRYRIKGAPVDMRYVAWDAAVARHHDDNPARMLKSGGLDAKQLVSILKTYAKSGGADFPVVNPLRGTYHSKRYRSRGRIYPTSACYVVMGDQTGIARVVYLNRSTGSSVDLGPVRR